jgi:glycosyltransferase involved in cell wall biosynthesis
VRNTPERRIEKSDATRFSLGLPIDKFIMIIQGSGLNVERGIEEVILAMHMIENSVLLIFGSGDIIPKAKELVKSEKLEAKVLFFNQRPYLEMMKFTMNSDIGLAIDKPDCDNYKFSLPNKVFDYIQARIPIFCSQIYEVQILIEQFDIVCSISSVNPKEIAEKVNFLLENPQILSQYKINCIKAAEIENWQNEKLKLKELILQSEKI